jgi:hypothetical protein
MSFAWTVNDRSFELLPFGADPAAAGEPGRRNAGPGGVGGGTGGDRPRPQHGAHARRQSVGARAGRLFTKT